MAELGTRRLGRTGMRPKALGLGCAHLKSDREAVEAIRRAIELGMDYLDTSPAYGESERRVGLALGDGWRERVYLETKVGTHPQRRQDFSAEATRWSVQNSLKILKTDYLDAVLIHDPHDIEDPLAPGRALEELLRMKDEGIVRHLGLGIRNQEFHKRAIETGQVEIVLSHTDCTLLNQSLVKTTIPLARQFDVGIILASALAGGSLAGPEPKHNARAHAMWDWCQQRGVNLRDLALQFCLALPIDGIVMPGPSNKEEVEEVYASATNEVLPEVWHDFKTEFGVGV